jgi:hypothetical protein
MNSETSFLVILVFNKLRWAAERPNVYRYLAGKDSLAPKERNVLSAKPGISLLQSSKVPWGPWFYKHFGPYGTDYRATQGNLGIAGIFLQLIVAVFTQVIAGKPSVIAAQESPPFFEANSFPLRVPK